tara:strand:+ start:624 stop:1493 length:870 start_codon:yes stop_codon:yes gene_type:complete
MSTKIIGNQIDATTRAIMEALQVTEQLNLPNLNQTQVTALGTPAYGTLVYNSTEDMAQIYKQDAAQGVPGWTDVGGGGPSVGENSIIRTNGTTIAENLTIGPVANGGVEFTNGFSAGPITIANGYTVTVENGASWNIIGGDDQMSLEVADIMTVDAKVTGWLHFSETKEGITYYNTTGGITHNWNNNNTIWLTKEGGGNFTLNLTNVPTGEGLGLGFTIVIEDQGGTGIPTTFQIDGVTHDVQWAGGSQPSHSNKYCVVSFAIIDKSPNPGTNPPQSMIVLGSAGNYDQ